VIVIQQQSGGAGIDCTRASHCCYYGISHSLGDYEQSLARLRRPGQTKTCRYYHFVVKNTVEETIYEALQNKRDVVEEVLSRLTRRVGK
jgi:SNF2 family DNA or RNA helicase